MNLHVRPATAADAAAVADLLSQLGYPAPAAAVAPRLERLSVDERVAVLVATAEDTVLGLATLHVLPVLHEDRPRGQLTALVVAETARGLGIGRALVDRAVELARTKGVRRFVVTTANQRTDTHQFYERLGFEWTGRRYGKILTDAVAVTEIPAVVEG